MFTSAQGINETAVIIGATCIVILLLVKIFINPLAKKKIKMPIPIELIVVSKLLIIEL